MVSEIQLERIFIEKDIIEKSLYQYMEVKALFYSFPLKYHSYIRLKRPLLSKSEEDWFFDSFAILNEKTKRLESIKSIYSDSLLNEIKKLILEGIQ